MENYNIINTGVKTFLSHNGYFNYTAVSYTINSSSLDILKKELQDLQKLDDGYYYNFCKGSTKTILNYNTYGDLEYTDFLNKTDKQSEVINYTIKKLTDNDCFYNGNEGEKEYKAFTTTDIYINNLEQPIIEQPIIEQPTPINYVPYIDTGIGLGIGIIAILFIKTIISLF